FTPSEPWRHRWRDVFRPISTMHVFSGSSPPARSISTTILASLRLGQMRLPVSSRRPRSRGFAPMPEQRKIAALLADAFQEEECFFPKIALNKSGYAVDVVSMGKAPIEIYSYFRRTGLLDVDRAIGEADPAEYAGILIAGGAKSPALLAEDERIRLFV